MDSQDGDPRGERQEKRIELELPEIAHEEITVSQRTFKFPKPEAVFEEGRQVALAYRDSDIERGATMLTIYSAFSERLTEIRKSLTIAAEIEQRLGADAAKSNLEFIQNFEKATNLMRYSQGLRALVLGIRRQREEDSREE